jgi:hypothetical protein
MPANKLLLSPQLLRRLQIISTCIMLVPSAILLFFSYLAATSPDHTAAEAIVLAIIGLGLTPIIYGLWAVVRWVRRNQEPDADPTSIGARLGKTPYLALVPISIMLGILAIGRSVDKPAESRNAFHSATSNFFAQMRAGCIASADSSATQSGANPSAPDVRAHINDYCQCFTTEVEKQYTPEEFSRVAALDSAGMSKEGKLNRLMASCTDRVEHS